VAAWSSWAWILSAPAGYLAIESGWVVRCVGRQPDASMPAAQTADGGLGPASPRGAHSERSAGEIYTVLLSLRSTSVRQK